MKKKLLFIVLAGTLLLTGCSGASKAEELAGVTLQEEVVAEDHTEEQAKKELQELRHKAEEKQSEHIDMTQVEKEETEEKGLEFVSREQLAKDSLPYYITNVQIKEKNNGKECISADTDATALKKAKFELLNDTYGNIIAAIDSDNADTIADIMTVILSQEVEDTVKADAIIRAVTAFKMGMREISSIEYNNGKFIVLDINGEKLENDTTKGTIKFKSKDTLPDEEEDQRISQIIFENYGVMLPREEARKELADEEEARLEAEELQKLAEAEEEQQKILAQLAAANAGRKFTDKNGNTASYTTEEWNYLLSVWAYTGHAETLVVEHTNQELRQLLNSR